MPEPCDLAGRGVLVTRPKDQAAALCRLIEMAGGRPIPFVMARWWPVVSIRRVDCSSPSALPTDWSAWLMA